MPAERAEPWGQWPRWIAGSFQRETGGPLPTASDHPQAHDRDADGSAWALYRSPTVVLCHDASADPRFVYANLAAQALWERDWFDFVGWRSAETAPAAERAERAVALATRETIRNYSGIRVSGTGRLFRIENATVWRISDDEGLPVGQAACFNHWQYMNPDLG